MIKKGLSIFSPLQVASIRVFVDFLTLTPLACMSLRYMPFSRWKYLLMAGLMGVFFPAFYLPLHKKRSVACEQGF